MQEVATKLPENKKVKHYNHSTDMLPVLTYYGAVNKFKSIRRAIRRGNVSPTGVIYPKRPFNSRKASKGREINESKKKIYGQLQEYRERLRNRPQEQD